MGKSAEGRHDATLSGKIWGFNGRNPASIVHTLRFRIHLQKNRYLFKKLGIREKDLTLWLQLDFY